MKRLSTLITGLGIVLLTLLSASRGHTQQPLADIALIIDSSGSMKENDPNNLRRNAAKFFIELADPNVRIANVRIAIVDFNGSAKTLARLTFADAVGTSQLRRVVDQIDSDGETDLSLALRQGFNELSRSNYPDAKKAAVMLTDGQNNDTAENPLRAVSSYVTRGWSVYTIGLGDDVDVELLRDIAEATAVGQYFPVTLDNMQTVYNRIIADITDDSIVRKYEGYVNTGQEVTKYAPIDNSVERAKFATNYGTGSKIDMLLMDPTGIEITPQSVALTPNIAYESGDTFAIYTVDKPKSGKYEMKVIGTDIPAQRGKYEVTVTATSDFVTNFLAFNSSYSIGDALRVGIRVREKIGNTTSALSGAITSAEIVRPDGQIDTLDLAYEGNGVYENTYQNMNRQGLYLLRVSVSGSGFSREVEEQVVVGAIDNVSIDNATLTPAAGATLAYAPSRISAAISGPTGKINHDSIVMKVDNQAVSHVYDCVNQIVSSRPSGLSDGGHTVQLTFRDARGNTIETTWPFTIGPAGAEVSYMYYWADWEDGKIQRANLDGSEVEDLITGLGSLYGIALDVPGGKVYWTSVGAGAIQCANLGGSEVEDLITGLGNLYGIALDVPGGKVYWTNVGAGAIQRANLDGSEVEDLITGLNEPDGIAVDVVNDKVYWVDLGAGAIQRANLDGSEVEDLITGLGNPYGIALDVPGGKMYWTNGGAGAIQRANLDGSEVEDLITGLGNPYGIALDVPADKMYWTNFDTGTIQRANLDGTDVQDFVLGLSGPTGITLSVSSEPTTLAAREDVNGDGVVDVQDLVYLIRYYGWTGQNNADVNADEIVDANDLILIAAMLDNVAAAPTTRARVQDLFTVEEVQQWLTEARLSADASFTYQRGIIVLEQILAVLMETEAMPKETVLLSNYPNPFNPETWIPYQLAEPADVTLSIYSVDGKLVRTLALGHQPAGVYRDRNRAAHWDGRNAFGERVASGLYFYTFTAGDFTATRKMLIRK